MTTDSADDHTAENDPGAAPPEPKPILPVVPLHQIPDQNLAAIAGIAYFIGYPVTLYMPWGIASGHTAAYNNYYRHLAEAARGGELPDDVPEGLVDVIDKFAANNFDKYAETPYSDIAGANFQDGFDLTSFVVLRDALCWIGGYNHPFRHPFLRLRLADVTAWAWGAMQP